MLPATHTHLGGNTLAVPFNIFLTWPMRLKYVNLLPKRFQYVLFSRSVFLVSVISLSSFVCSYAVNVRIVARLFIHVFPLSYNPVKAETDWHLWFWYHGMHVYYKNGRRRSERVEQVFVCSVVFSNYFSNVFFFFCYTFSCEMIVKIRKTLYAQCVYKNENYVRYAIL